MVTWYYDRMTSTLTIWPTKTISSTGISATYMWQEHRPSVKLYWHLYNFSMDQYHELLCGDQSDYDVGSCYGGVHTSKWLPHPRFVWSLFYSLISQRQTDRYSSAYGRHSLCMHACVCGGNCAHYSLVCVMNLVHHSCYVCVRWHLQCQHISNY